MASTKSTKSYISVFPHGLVITGAGVAPFILFKDEEGKQSFPIWMPYNPVKMQHNISDTKLFRASPLLTQEITGFLGYKMGACFFEDVKSGVQWANIELIQKETKEIKSLRVLAYEAFSLGALDVKTKYYASEDFIQETRENEIQDKSHLDFTGEKALRKSGQKYLM